MDAEGYSLCFHSEGTTHRCCCVVLCSAEKERARVMYSPRLRILRAKTLHIAPLNDYLAFVWICLAWVEVLIQASEREVCVCVCVFRQSHSPVTAVSTYIWALAAASAAVHYGDVGIKGELHRNRNKSLVFPHTIIP